MVMEKTNKIRHRVWVEDTTQKIFNLDTILELGIRNLDQYRYFGMVDKGSIR
jgi:hypothetical protein